MFVQYRTDARRRFIKMDLPSNFIRSLKPAADEPIDLQPIPGAGEWQGRVEFDRSVFLRNAAEPCSSSAVQFRNAHATAADDLLITLAPVPHGGEQTA